MTTSDPHINPAAFFFEDLDPAELRRQADHLCRCRPCIGRMQAAALLLAHGEALPPPAARRRGWPIALAVAATLGLFGLAGLLGHWALGPAAPASLATREPIAVIQTGWRSSSPGTAAGQGVELYQQGRYRQAADYFQAHPPVDDAGRLIWAVSLYLCNDLAAAEPRLDQLARAADARIAGAAGWYRVHCALRRNDRDDAVGRLEPMARAPGPFREAARDLLKRAAR